MEVTKGTTYIDLTPEEFNILTQADELLTDIYNAVENAKTQEPIYLVNKCGDKKWPMSKLEYLSSDFDDFVHDFSEGIDDYPFGECYRFRLKTL